MPDYKLISADSHLNEVEATWKLARKKLGDRAPYIVWNPKKDPVMRDGQPADNRDGQTADEIGPFIVVNDGWTSRNKLGVNRESCIESYLGFVIGGLNKRGSEAAQAPNREASIVGRFSRNADEFRRSFRFEDYPGGGLDPAARLRDQDQDGVEAEVLYASHLRHFWEITAKDELFFHDLAESYNEWMMDFCSENPKRLIGLPAIPVHNPAVASADIYHYAKRGAKGFMINSSVPQDMNYGDPMFDPIWAAAQECGTPLSMHTSSGRFKQPHYNFPRAHRFVGQQVEVQISLGEMIYGGVFDRFPRLKIVSTEFDVGWVAFMIQRNDARNPHLGLKLSPADYVRRNVWFTFQDDRVGMLTASYFGEDNFLWASDFPHGVTTWPDSHAIVDLQMEGLSAETKRKIARQNTIDLYNLDL